MDGLPKETREQEGLRGRRNPAPFHLGRINESGSTRLGQASRIIFLAVGHAALTIDPERSKYIIHNTIQLIKTAYD